MTKKRLFINLLANIVSFIVTLSISFVLTPVIVGKVGDAAYGFVGLANNFVSYASIFTIVINSMASRFITFELTKRNTKEANKYFASVFYMNAIMSVCIFFSTIIIVLFLNKILNIPDSLLLDVKLTFILAFSNLILSLFLTIYNISSFSKNRLDLSALRNIIGNIIRSLILIILFSLLPAKIYYIILSTVLMNIYLVISNYKLTKKIAPELKVSKDNFSKKHLKKLAKSGIWNSINSLSKTLLTGLDLLISNIFIGPTAMGILSIAKTVPTAIEQMLAVFANTFNPEFVILYSSGKINELVQHIKFSLKVVALIMLVPIAGYIVFGYDFFSLWLPGKSVFEINQIQILSILSVMPFLVSASNYTLFVTDSVTNKLKRPMIATLIMSLLSTIITLILIKTTNLGIYAVAGVSSILWIIKVSTFNVINSAINLNIKWYTFYPSFLKNLVTFTVIVICFYIAKSFVIINSWLSLIIYALLFGIIGYIFAYLFLLNKEEKIKINNIIINKIKRKA